LEKIRHDKSNLSEVERDLMGQAYRSEVVSPEAVMLNVMVKICDELQTTLTQLRGNRRVIISSIHKKRFIYY
jgi:hypothetical protein